MCSTPDIWPATDKIVFFKTLVIFKCFSECELYQRMLLFSNGNIRDHFTTVLFEYVKPGLLWSKCILFILRAILHNKKF